MKTTIFRSLVTATTVGFIFSLFVNMVMASTMQRDYVTGAKIVLTGIDAVKDIVNTTGIISFIILCIGQFVFFFLAVFFGCISLDFWRRKDEIEN